MHEIQKHILKKLSLAKTARYADLKPKYIDGNLFVYHLKALVKVGYVSSGSGKYSLTTKGKRYVGGISFETFSERAQPKIVNILIIKDKGKYLLYKRKRAPFTGLVGFPYGKIHLEEKVFEAAERELKEKTGLKARLHHRGEVYLTVHEEDELIEHMLCHVFTASKHTNTINSPSDIGECFWSTLEEIPKNKLIPGVKEISKLISKNKENFFEEYFLNV